MTCPQCGADVAVEETAIEGSQIDAEPIPSDASAMCLDLDATVPRVFWHRPQASPFEFSE